MSKLQRITRARSSAFFRLAGAAAFLTVVLACAAPARSQTLDHSSGFDDYSDMAYNGSAFFVNGLYTDGLTVARLNDGDQDEAGSVFTLDLFDIRAFSTSFIMQSRPTNSGFGDGITFTIQGSDPFQLGQTGGGLGYAGIGSSVAVKFATYETAPRQSRTGLYINGEYPNTHSIDLTGTGIDLANQRPYRVEMNYDGMALNVSISDLISGVTASQAYTVNIPAIVGFTTAYVGFTGGTGGDTAIQDIRSWVYYSQPE